MELKKQVCPLNEALELKKLGVGTGTKRMSLYYFVMDGDFGTTWKLRSYPHTFNDEKDACAFTATELGVMLPATTRSFLTPTGYWIASFENVQQQGIGSTEAEARAQLLILLIKQKVITAAAANYNLIH